MREDRRIGRGNRYGLLLATLVSVYLLSALSTGETTDSLRVAFFAGVALLAIRNAALSRRTKVVISSLAVTGSVILAVLLASPGGRGARGAANLWIGALLLLTVVLILERVLRLETVTIQSIYGALSAYLIIGLMFAAFFAAIDYLYAAPFFVNGEPANTRTFQYFSFTTLTTLGYGDFTAAGNFGRAVAVLEALTGQVFLATLVARLVSAYRGPARGDPPSDAPSGESDPAGAKNPSS